LTMWDADSYSTDNDLEDADIQVAMRGGKDVPCNTHIYFDAREGKLNMTVLCRSNDLWWGAYGANAVHFSVLQEYMAFATGIPVGLYRQFSNNYHLYTAVVPQERLSEFANDAKAHDLYTCAEGIEPFPLISTSIEAWEKDLKLFMANPSGTMPYMYTDPFFARVAAPMYCAWHLRKNKAGDGLEFANQIAATDWRRACVNWIERREAAKEAKHATARS